MKISIRPFAILFATAMLAASCLSTDDETDITYYGDTAISSFSLGTLNREIHTTTSDGTKDSTYTGTVDASTYKFYIDQLRGEIYNTDSLPVRTDAKKVVCTIETKNGGIVALQDINSDTLRYFSAADSLDFTPDTGRIFRVYSTDGTSNRKYRVKVNVHKEDPDSFSWKAIMTAPTNVFAGAKAMRAMQYKDKIFVFASDGTTTSVYSTPVNGASAWTKIETEDAQGKAMSLDGAAYASATVFENMLYTLSGGSILLSAEGKGWLSNTLVNAPAHKSQPVDQIPDIRRLLGATSRKLYAITADGSIIWSELHGIAWYKDQLVDASSDMLPAADITLSSYTLGTDESAERVILVGNRNIAAGSEDSTALVWSKIEETAGGSQEHSWILVTTDNRRSLPSMEGLQTLSYGGVLTAIGGAGLGKSAVKALDAIYTSRDNGLTWYEDSKYVMPEKLDNGGSSVFAVTADSDRCLWIICGGTGQVWRGRLNSLGWKEDQTAFTK